MISPSSRILVLSASDERDDVAAATAKLFLFDLGTLDGIFRVVVFIVVGLVLLGMGAGYGRILERQDQQQDQSA